MVTVRFLVVAAFLWSQLLQAAEFTRKYVLGETDNYKMDLVYKETVNKRIGAHWWSEAAVQLKTAKKSDLMGDAVSWTSVQFMDLKGLKPFEDQTQRAQLSPALWISVLEGPRGLPADGHNTPALDMHAMFLESMLAFQSEKTGLDKLKKVGADFWLSGVGSTPDQPTKEGCPKIKVTLKESSAQDAVFAVDVEAAPPGHKCLELPERMAKPVIPGTPNNFLSIQPSKNPKFPWMVTWGVKRLSRIIKVGRADGRLISATHKGASDGSLMECKSNDLSKLDCAPKVHAYSANVAMRLERLAAATKPVQ